MTWAARWRVVPAGLLCAALAVAGCGGVADRSATGEGGTAGTRSSSPPGRGSELSAQEIDELEKMVSDAEGAADQAEHDATDP